MFYSLKKKKGRREGEKGKEVQEKICFLSVLESNEEG